MGLNALAGVASASVGLIEIQRESLPVGECISRLWPARWSLRWPLTFFAATPTLTSRLGGGALKKGNCRIKKEAKRFADGKPVIRKRRLKKTPEGVKSRHRSFAF